jgi:hypothetical protein
MLVRSIRRASENFSKPTSEAEGGETALITRNGRFCERFTKALAG